MIAATKKYHPQIESDGVSDFDPERLYQDMLVAGTQWADLNAAADILEKTTTTLRAQLILEYISRGSSGAKRISKAEAELLALVDMRYIDHVSAAVNEKKSANQARVRYDACKALIELKRTEQSNRRAAMNLI